MKILVFDQASSVTGFCLYQHGRIIESGIIDKHKIKDSDVRIAEMSMAICENIKDNNPSLVVIEGIQNQSSIATVVLLGRLQGMILGYCYANKIRTEILSPTRWRSTLGYKQGPGVKRSDLKQQSIDYVEEKFGITGYEEDRFEAICIAVAADMLFNNTADI